MELTRELSRLLSLQATSSDHKLALENIQKALLESTHSNSKQSSWQASQDHLSTNAASVVLEFIARVAYRFQLIDTLDYAVLSYALKLLQGLLLIHRPSASLFSRTSTLETLLALLANPTASPLVARSPVPGSQEAELPVLVLDTILCGLADQPDNIRAFEEVGGVAEVARLLRSKQAGKATRMKCLEMLYFYLLPEQEVEKHLVQSELPSRKSQQMSEPSTPRRVRYKSDSLRALLERTEDEWTPRTPRREARHTPDVLSPSASAPSFAPLQQSHANAGLGLSRSTSHSDTPDRQTAASDAPKRPERTPSRHTKSRSTDGDNPFVVTNTPATPPHDMAFFSALANARSQPRQRPDMSRRKSENTKPSLTASPRPFLGSSSASREPASPSSILRSPMKRSLISSPSKSGNPSSNPEVTPRRRRGLYQSSSSATPSSRHPIVPLPSRRRSAASQGSQHTPSSSSSTSSSQALGSPNIMRSTSATSLPDTPKSELSRSTSEESPLNDILSGNRQAEYTDSPLSVGVHRTDSPGVRRRASVQLSQSRSALRHSLGLLSTTNTPTASPRPSSRESAHDKSPALSSARRDSTPSSPSKSSSASGNQKKKAVPSPVAFGKSSSSQSHLHPSVKSTDEKKQLLSRHLGDVDGLLRKFKGTSPAL